MSHLKRHAIPKSWPIQRKGTAFVVQPNVGFADSLPVLIILRDILNVAQNRKEAKKMIHMKNILVNGKEDIEKIRLSNEVHLFSQTTMSVKEYNDLAEAIILKMNKQGIPDAKSHFHKNNTICGQVSNRQPRLKTFAKKHDVIIFVSGRESSNGKMLYEVCKNENPNTWFVSSPGEIKKEWFLNCNSAGICGATSTPKWLIDKIKDTILSI